MRAKIFSMCLILCLVFLNPVLAEDAEEVLKSIKGGEIFEFNKVLASPEMEGRLSGTAGYDRAARWAAAQFKEWGLKPVYGDNFLQAFPVDCNEMRETFFSLILPSAEKDGKPEIKDMEIYTDFCPTLYSGFGEVKTEVVFAGFGIVDSELGWDDYKGLDVRGKIVAFFNGTPRIEGKNFQKYLDRQPKLEVAAARGAAGLILINRVVVSVAGRYMEDLPMVMVGDGVAELLFKSRGHDVKGMRALLRDGQHLSFPTGIMAEIRAYGAHHDDLPTYNVVGKIEGSDPVLKEEYIIFGGHLDHLGPWPVLHPGASDNASGSAVVMGLAQAFSRLENRPKRSVVFALFAAEETGLLGSEYMAENPPDSPSKPLLMSNHDMNGVGTSISVSGGKTYPELYNLMVEANTTYKINDNLSAGGISSVGGNSDYAPFLERGIPAYSTWVRGGQRYGTHTAEDSIYIITPKVMEDIVKLYFMAGYRFLDK